MNRTTVTFTYRQCMTSINKFVNPRGVNITTHRKRKQTESVLYNMKTWKTKMHSSRMSVRGVSVQGGVSVQRKVSLSRRGGLSIGGSLSTPPPVNRMTDTCL